MGGLLGCVKKVPEVVRQDYDLTPIKLNPVPVLWLLGPPGSGKTTLGQALSENKGYIYIKIADILKEDSKKHTHRGATVKEALSSSTKKIPDELVVDVIKEAMIQSANSSVKGYILNGFPRTEKQGKLFVKEIGNVDVVLYLYSGMDVMVERVLQKKGYRLDAESTRKEITNYSNEMKNAISRFDAKVEKICTQACPRDMLGKIQAVVNARLKIKSPNS